MERLLLPTSSKFYKFYIRDEKKKTISFFILYFHIFYLKKNLDPNSHLAYVS